MLVVTDAVDAFWARAPIRETLRAWGQYGPVALVQVLPQRSWAQTRLGEADAAVAASRPGQPNDQLEVVPPWWWLEGKPPDHAVPVVGLDEASLSPWARMVMGAPGVSVPGVFAVPEDDVDGASGQVGLPGEVDLDRLGNVLRSTVSAQAYRLAVLLSAVEVSLPIARIVMHELMPDARLAHLAELIAAGVLKAVRLPEPGVASAAVRVGAPLPAAPSGGGADRQVALTFAPSLRELFQRSLTVTMTLQVWRTVAPYLEATHGLRFSLLLQPPNTELDAVAGTDELREGLQAITADLADRLGLVSSPAADRQPSDDADDVRRSPPAAGGPAGTEPTTLEDQLDSSVVPDLPADQPGPKLSAPGGFPDRSGALDHVVVIMFGGRSFDNLLGRLYEPGEVASFTGVTGLDLSNPVPDWAADTVPGSAARLVPYGTAVGMSVPSPGPGEEYPHVNTQLFGLIDPPSNRGMVAEHMVAPYNSPANPGLQPTMDGFVTDYISAFIAEMGRTTVFEEYAQIMTGYAPQQVPVISALARGFATFDHWFCEVPGPAFPNLSFFHAGTSSGFAENVSPPGSFPIRNMAQTIFERLEARGLTWRVYCDPPKSFPLTGLIHASRLRERWETNFFTTDRFLEDAASGQLPTYSFIEPNLLYGHNDMRPAFDAPLPGVDLDPPSSLLRGEALLAKIYDAIRSSSSPDGSNAYNTLLLVTFDGHGGTYDHVAPPPARAPDPSAPPGQMGFRFDRSGLRVPTIAVSAWIPRAAVITDECRGTSLIATLRRRWDLGAPLTRRDAAARDLLGIIALHEPRNPADWPDVRPRPVPPRAAGVNVRAPLRGLPKAAFFAVLELCKNLGLPAPDLRGDEVIDHADAAALVNSITGDMFPGLQDTS